MREILSLPAFRSFYAVCPNIMKTKLSLTPRERLDTYLFKQLQNNKLLGWAVYLGRFSLLILRLKRVIHRP